MTNLQTVVRQGFGRRLLRAHKRLETREGVASISRRVIAERLAKVLGLKTAMDQSTVASWFAGILPPPDIGVGLAFVYDVPAGWLYFAEFGNMGSVPTSDEAELPQQGTGEEKGRETPAATKKPRQRKAE